MLKTENNGNNGLSSPVADGILLYKKKGEKKNAEKSKQHYVSVYTLNG